MVVKVFLLLMEEVEAEVGLMVEIEILVMDIERLILLLEELMVVMELVEELGN